MISTRNVLNQQAQAIGGQARRYEQPVSSFTNMAMPTVASLSRPRQKTPTQSMPPSTLSAMSSGVMGGGTPQISADVPSPVGAFRQGVARDMAIDMAVPSIVRGALSNLVAMSAGAPLGALRDVSMAGIIGAPQSALSTIANIAFSGYISDDVSKAFNDPEMDQATYDAISQMAGPESIDDPTEAFSPQQMSDWDTTRQEFAAMDNLTSNPLKSLGYALGLVDMPERTPTSLVGEDFVEKRNAAIDAALNQSGVFDAESNYRSGAVDSALDASGVFDAERGYREGLNQSIDSALDATGVFGRDAIGLSMNETFGDFSEAGKAFGGQVGNLDPSFRDFEAMMDKFDRMFGGVFGGGGQEGGGGFGGMGDGTSSGGAGTSEATSTGGW